jgi:hypothetical protein
VLEIITPYGYKIEKPFLNKMNNTINYIQLRQTMNHVKKIERRTGVDIGYHSSNIDPIDREGCIGKNGINKSFTFEMVLELACKMADKPNIIIKAGKNAKWYLKHSQKDKIEGEIEKQNWRDTSRCTMYIIDWE